MKNASQLHSATSTEFWPTLHWWCFKSYYNIRCPTLAPYFNTIEGFHVTSYQANSASHHTHNCHVDFLFARQSIRKHNKTFHYFIFSSCHNTKLQLVTGILAHFLCWNVISSAKKLKLIKFLSILLFFLYCAIQRGNKATWQNHALKGKSCVVQTLYRNNLFLWQPGFFYKMKTCNKTICTYTSCSIEQLWYHKSCNFLSPLCGLQV